MAKVTAVQHVAFEDLGTLGDLFAARKWPVTYLDAPTMDWDAFDPMAPDLLVILGGPISVNDGASFPFLRSEIAALQKRLAADKPTLGICLGAQLIAHALGAKVYPVGEKEIGWRPLLLSNAGYASPVRHLAAEHTFMFHWHGETFDLPKDSTLLAGTAVALHQAFSWGKGTLAFQCHPEVRTKDLERWYVGHTAEISTTWGINVPSLRGQGQRYGAALERQAKLCFNEWLDGLKL